MTQLERLQALERELADLSLRLTDLRIDEIRDALVNAAPDLIAVAVALQALGHEPGCLIDPFATLTDEERDESKCDCILSLLAPLLEELGE